MTLNDTEKKARMDLQKRIQAAVLGDGEWDGVSSDLRRQADTPWFRSFLAFSPEPIMKKVDQPILLVHGELDRTVAVHHVDRLLELAQARRKDSKDVADTVKLPGINHLLVEAETGDIEEYPRLAGKRVSPEVAKTVIDWLGKTMIAR
jgi:pimeloyl-ACP methyl ester carboxylesterase